MPSKSAQIKDNVLVFEDAYRYTLEMRGKSPGGYPDRECVEVTAENNDGVVVGVDMTYIEFRAWLEKMQEWVKTWDDGSAWT